MATRKGTPRAGRKKASPPASDAPAAPNAAARFPIVGLGASAGGLEAFEQFFSTMPADSNMGFVLIQHLDPSHPSILAEILRRSTKMPVVEAQDQMVVLPNRVHVIPPNRDMVIFQGALQLSMPSEPRGQRMPIDAFLRSLAEDQGDNAIGIILSGTGTDGTLGLRAIFGAGGLCLAQDPATAKYDGMPGSVVRAGYANRVLPVEQMAQALRDGTRPLPIRQAVAAPSPGAASGLNKILMQLRSATGHDFSQYKKSTIGRRIERRMAQHNIEEAEVYARYLKEHPAEVQTLFRELLINVTSFFRDPQAFAVLKSSILPPLLADKTESNPLRVWVAGCATGEEAYSIAILLREAMEDMQREFKVQIYSTDLDDEAITAARAGLYPPNIAQDMQPERLRRYFVKEDAGYRVKKEIREMVVFAVQSVIKDPPFTRLDLLACRNLMIYLEPELQNGLIPTFHYALNPGGVLFLSSSESIGTHTELFEPIDRKWKFYRARASVVSTLAPRTSELPMTIESSRQAPAEARVSGKGAQLGDLARRSLLQAFAPAAVVTDLQGDILYVHGETGRFLRPAPGQPTHNVVEMAREGLELELREALRRAASQGQPTLNRPLQIRTEDKALPVSLSVRLLPDPDNRHPVLLVSFQELVTAPQPKPARRPRTAGSAADQRIEELQRELAYAKDSLKATLEEQQASNEELKSTNEEMQSTNEELQSTNEELETSKEELQSVNEELVTVNAELQFKIEQMAGMQDDMKNLLDNIHIGTIFLDRRLTIRRFTRDATKAFRLMATDVGRPLADIRCELEGADLLCDAQLVLESLVPVEREVSARGGVWYLARIQPYRTVDNVIDGVVLTFADVTERVQALAVRKARDLAEAIVDAVQAPLVVLDDKLHVVSVNRAYCREFGGDTKGAVGLGFFDIGSGRWDFAAMHDLLENVLAREHQFARRTLNCGPAAPGHQAVQVSGRRIGELAGADAFVLLSIEPAPSATD